MPHHMYFGVLTIVLTLVAMQTGLTDQLSSCGYVDPITEPNYNPVATYSELPARCRLGNSIGKYVCPSSSSTSQTYQLTDCLHILALSPSIVPVILLAALFLAGAIIDYPVRNDGNAQKQ
jgi:hypothetical protein